MKPKNTTAEQDTLAGRGRGVISSVRVSCRPDSDYHREKDYRTIYAKEGLEVLYIDAEIFNRQVGANAWEGEVTVHLFHMDGKKTLCVAEKKTTLKFGQKDIRLQFEEVMTKEDVAGGDWQEGEYCVTVAVDGQARQSEGIRIMEGGSLSEAYFQVLHAGIDRVCEETEEEAGKRTHSFRMLDARGLYNVRLLFVAQNLLGREWEYEFVIRVVGKDGILKTVRWVRASQFVHREDVDLLVFATDFGRDGDWAEEGEYTAVVSFLGRVLFSLPFAIGGKDEPYDFKNEIFNTGEQSPLAGVEMPAYSPAAKDEIMSRLYALVGLRKVKDEIARIVEYAEFLNLRREHGFNDRILPTHLVFTGHPGTGKNTVAAILGELYRVLGVLSNGKVHRCKRSDLVKEGEAVEEQLVRRTLQASNGGVLFIEGAGDLFRPDEREDRGVVALGMLFAILKHEHPEVLVILADDEEMMDFLTEALPDLKKIFTKQLCFEDYTPEELMEIARHKLEKLQYRFTPAAEEKFFKQLQTACTAKEVDFTNGRYIDEQLETAAQQMARRLMAQQKAEYTKDDLALIDAEDIPSPETGDPGKAIEKLNALVGLGEVKRSILQHLNYVYFIRERQKHGFSDFLPPLNMIFSGNPGTGKATVAKMIAEIYHAIGILERPNVVEEDGRSLLSENGTSPVQVADLLLDMSAGAMLYINYADVLPQTEYGLALFESLLAGLSLDGCGDNIVVLGGYPDRVAQMLEVNPSLRRYFPYTFQFVDYTPEELMSIAEDKLGEKCYTFHPKAKEAFALLVRKAYENWDKNFGNVLLVEKIVGLAIRNMSDRTMSARCERELTQEELTTICPEDIPVEIFDLPKLSADGFDEKEIRDALAELDQMVGQAGIKQQINEFVELARHYSRNGTKLSSQMSLQWCLTGNSAMGKGTVARIIARLYKAIGILPTDKVLSFKVERMIGLMEEEAQRSIGEALVCAEGGILLFDEDSLKLNDAIGFRERVRAILMNQMAERPGSHLIIYAEPRNRLAGLIGGAERISEVMNVLVFEDYTCEELMVILKRRLQKENMKMTATARQYMGEFIRSLVSTEERSHASSRLMRIVADMIVRNCLQRVAKNSDKGKAAEVISVQKQDVAMFTEQFVASIMKERKRIGFV